MKEILFAALRTGVKFHLEGDDLRISAAPGSLNAELRQKIRDHKAELVQLLRRKDTTQAALALPQVVEDLPNRHVPFPLTDVQYAYWMGRKNVAQLGNVSTHFYFELDCPSLDLPLFNRALWKLIERHEMLRAVIADDGLQRILPEVSLYHIDMNDCRAMSPEQAEDCVTQLREQMSAEVLPANKWPLFSVKASATPNGHMRMHFSLDMLILDAWSIFLLFKEWFQVYRSLEAGLPEASLEPIALSYRDYLLAERQLLDNAEYRRAHDYWMARVDSLPAAPALPIVNGPTSAAPRFSRRRDRIDSVRWAMLKEMARAKGLTLSGLLLAVYAEVLMRWSGSAHFTLNLTLFNRLPLHPDVRQLLGDFTSLVMLEVDYRETGTTFQQRAQKLQRQLMEDLEHREFSGVQVLREWSQRRHTNLQAVMPVVFTSALVFGSDNNEGAGLVEQFGPMVYGVSQTPQVWLDNQAMEINGELVFNWDAVDALFEPGVLDSMFAAFLQLLHTLADEPARWSQPLVVELPVPMQALRIATNKTEAPVEHGLLQDGFLSWVEKTPDAPAVIAANRTLSYRQLLLESQVVADNLIANRVQPGELVGIMMHKGWEQIVAVFGTLLAGAAYMPVDAGLPRARQLQLLEIAEARQVLVQEGFLRGKDSDAFDKHVIHEVRAGAVVARSTDAPALLDWQSPESLAYVIFTSGTTGTPKGVIITHAAALNTIKHINRLFDVTDRDRVLAVSSLSFDLSVYDIFGLLAAGGAIVLPEHGTHLDPVAWKRAIVEHSVTLWNSAPQLMRMLMNAFDHNEQGHGLRHSLLSGDWIPLDLPDRIVHHYPGIKVTGLGGATEASIWSNYYHVEQIDPSWNSIPYGKPLPNQTIWVLDAKMQPCPDHVTSHIFIGGLGLAQGYWHDAEKTARRFITHPQSGERLYDTGDLGRYAPDGNIIFLGRDDTQVKIRGYRVEPGEIAVVLRQHPDIEEAAVMVNTSGKENRELIAYLQLTNNPHNTLATMLVAGETALHTFGSNLQQWLGEIPGDAKSRMLNDSFRHTWTSLDDLYLSSIQNVLMHFGVQGEIGERIVLEQIMVQGVALRYRRWMQRAFNALVEDGFAQRCGNGVIQLIKAMPRPQLQQSVIEIGGRLQADLQFTLQEVDWFFDVVRNISDILTEKIRSAELYASDNMTGLYEKMFPDSYAELTRIFTGLLHEKGDGLAILEVGGGLGTATAHILPLLAQHGCQYTFTDISEFFLTRAHQQFDPAHYPVDFGLLNVDIRPEFQGYAHHSYDLVCAFSMLHDVRDIKLALGNLRDLLKPGGQLVILEQTRFFRSFDLQSGLQQDFDSFEDESLRTVHSLLSREQWQMVLRDTGFVDVGIAGTAGSVADYLGFHVIVANAPMQVAQLDHTAVTAYLSSLLPDYMVPRHLLHLESIPVSQNGKIDYKALPVIPEQVLFAHDNKVAPRTPTEQVLLDIWTRLMPGYEMGVTDNFFDVGGDSLIATQVIKEINETMSFNLEMNDFFENMSIEALAKLYDSREIVIDLL